MNDECEYVFVVIIITESTVWDASIWELGTLLCNWTYSLFKLVSIDNWFVGGKGGCVQL